MTCTHLSSAIFSRVPHQIIYEFAISLEKTITSFGRGMFQNKKQKKNWLISFDVCKYLQKLTDYSEYLS